MIKRQITYFSAQENYKLNKSYWLGSCFENRIIEEKYNKIYRRETSFSLKIGISLVFLLSIFYIAFNSKVLTGDCFETGNCLFFEIILIPLFLAKIFITLLIKFSNDNSILHNKLKTWLYIVGIIAINFYGPNSDIKDHFPIYYRCIARTFQVVMANSLSSLDIVSCLKNFFIDLISMLISVLLWRNTNFFEEISSFFIYNLLIIVTLIITAKNDFLMRNYYMERLNTSFQTKYYSNCLNNMTCSLISINKGKVEFVNKCFQEAVMNLKKKGVGGNMKRVNTKFTIDCLSSLVNSKTKKTLLNYHNQLHSKYLNKTASSSKILTTINRNETCQSFHKKICYNRFKQNLKGIFHLSNNTKQNFLISLKGMRLPNGDVMFNYIINNITDFRRAQQVKAESKLKENLFSYIAHEIKTPLLTLNLMMDDLKNIFEKNPREDEDPLLNLDCRELISTSKNLSDSTMYLIDDIIHYCVESTNKTADLKCTKIQEAVKLSTVAEDMYGILKCKLKYGGGVRLEVDHICEMDPDLTDIQIKIDYRKLKQIIYNIISNSIKYTKSGFIKVSIKKESESSLTKSKSVSYKEDVSIDHEVVNSMFTKRGTMPHKFNIQSIETVSIIIEDTGIGISDRSLLDEINNGLITMDLNKNYNLNSGLGIGLKIVKRLCATLKIKPVVNSSVNYGTKITLTMHPSCILRNASQNHVNSISEVFHDDIISTEEAHNSKKSVVNLIEEPNSSSNDLTIEITDYKIEEDLAGILMLESHNSSKTSNKKKQENLGGSVKFAPVQTLTPPILRSSNKGSRNKISSRNGSCILPIVEDSTNENRAKIIICEDNDLIRNSIYKLFTGNSKINLAYNVLVCSDGIDLLQLIKDDQKKGNTIKAVFTDENMEYMNGSKAATLINELIKSGKVKSLKIFSVTAFEDDTTKKKILSSGIIEILSKPLNKDAIEETMTKYNLI